MKFNRLIVVGLVLWTGALAAQQTAILDPAQVIEAERGAEPGKPPVITALAILPGGGMVATAGDDHTVRLWSTTSGRIVQTFKGHSDWVRSLAFSPDGQWLASGGDDRRIIVWQVASGKIALRLATQAAVYSVAYSPDSSLLVGAGFERHVRLYDARSGKPVTQLAGPSHDLRVATFSPDGKQLAVAGRGGQIRVWDVETGKTRIEIVAGTHRLRTLAYLPEGDKLVSAGEGRTISIWDAASGQEVYKFDCPSGKVLAMAVCGEYQVATGGSDNMIRVWNWQTQAEQEQLRGHTGSVASLAYDPASGMLISGSYDTTVRVWRVGGEKPTEGTASPNKLDSKIR